MRVSGRYEGFMTAPRPGGEWLVLRVDVDEHVQNSPVLNRMSADAFAAGNPGGARQSWRADRSWIVEQPALLTSAPIVVILGTARPCQGPAPPFEIRVRISVDAEGAASADVSVRSADGSETTYTCARAGAAFRELELEIDFCRSVGALHLPAYDVTSDPIRPADLVERTLDIETAFKDAGVGVSRVSGQEIDDSDPKFEHWSEAELNDALTLHFTAAHANWPRWSLWGLLAGRSDSDYAGVMFDHVDPARQGFAIFRFHGWFAPLLSGNPSAALRTYLFAWMHEMGHAFNLMHPDRDDALTWMGHPTWFHPDNNAHIGVGEFWKQFRFRFSDDELIHLRHGCWDQVVMGGQPSHHDDHLSSREPGVSVRGSVEHAQAVAGPLELSVRGSHHVDFMTPVTVELRLLNRADSLVKIDSRLQPQDGNVTLFVRRPDRRVTRYRPLTCRLRQTAMADLGPTANRESIADRYSEEIDITYGRGGFYFDVPGEYEVQATYQSASHGPVVSAPFRFRVAAPGSPEAERLAQDFFSPEVGDCLYFEGSQSPHLSRGFSALQDLAARRARTVSGSRLAARIARGIAAPFFRVENDVVRRVKKPDPEGAIRSTDEAARVFLSTTDRSFNLAHGRLSRLRAAWKQLAGDTRGAHRELKDLHRALEARGVHEPVLGPLRHEIDRLDPTR